MRKAFGEVLKFDGLAGLYMVVALMLRDLPLNFLSVLVLKLSGYRLKVVVMFICTWSGCDIMGELGPKKLL